VRDTRRRQEQGGPGNQEQFKPYRLEIQRAAPPEHVVADFPSINVAQLPAGTNFLVSSATSLPFEPFLEFLADKAFTRSSRHLRLHKSIKTVEAWTSDLRDFFAFLDAMKIVWQDANEDILLAQSTQVKQSRNWPRARPSRIFDTALDSRRNRLTPLALREAAAVFFFFFFFSLTRGHGVFEPQAPHGPHTPLRLLGRTPRLRCVPQHRSTSRASGRLLPPDLPPAAIPPVTGKVRG
jgi:hypothetical protein